MSIDHLPQNLRLLCSYGRSTSDICRRAGINRYQFDKYLTGRSQPSLSTLRRICDFFGVEDHEILLDQSEFKELIRLRPPRLGENQTALDQAVGSLIGSSTSDQTLLERHEGYYHTYLSADPESHDIQRSLCRIYKRDGAWLSKTVERHHSSESMLPPRLKYTGVVLEAYRRIVVHEREQGTGRSLWANMVYASDHAEPTFLPGLALGMWAEGSHDINCVRTVWQYLGKEPNLRIAIGQCGLINQDSPDLPDFVRYCVDNTQQEDELVFFAKF